MELWNATPNYMGKLPTDYYVLISQNRDSGILDKANFIAAKKALDYQGADYTVLSFNHWAVGWVEGIFIHQSEIESVEIANNIEDSLNDYPVLDDELYSSMEWDSARDIAIDMIRYGEFKGTVSGQWLNQCIDHCIESGIVQ
jgi:hypothetical protein